LHVERATMTRRLLIVDGSDLTAWLVAHAVPAGVEVVRAATFAQAVRILRDAPPDVAIFNLTPSHLDWRTLLETCDRHEPPVPFLCTSPLDEANASDSPLPCRPERFCPKSLLVPELRARIERLIEAATAAPPR
jgi:DNA-binding NarL/FixJ family response regulator